MERVTEETNTESPEVAETIAKKVDTKTRWYLAQGNYRTDHGKGFKCQMGQSTNVQSYMRRMQQLMSQSTPTSQVSEYIEAANHSMVGIMMMQISAKQESKSSETQLKILYGRSSNRWLTSMCTPVYMLNCLQKRSANKPCILLISLSLNKIKKLKEWWCGD